MRAYLRRARPLSDQPLTVVTMMIFGRCGPTPVNATKPWRSVYTDQLSACHGCPEAAHDSCCVESGSIREYQESRSGMGVSGVPDIREPGAPLGTQGTSGISGTSGSRIRDGGITEVLSLISLIQHRTLVGAVDAGGLFREAHVPDHWHATSVPASWPSQSLGSGCPA
jgi:hypothetical protein